MIYRQPYDDILHHPLNRIINPTTYLYVYTFSAVTNYVLNISTACGFAIVPTWNLSIDDWYICSSGVYCSVVGVRVHASLKYPNICYGHEQPLILPHVIDYRCPLFNHFTFIT